MNYIIYNHDGSIKNVNFADIIVQGNNLVDEIFVAVEGRSTDSYLATAYFDLPNGDSNFLTATLASHSIDQSAYNGYKFLLTGAQTAFYGRVRMSLKLEGMQGETLWTYEQVLTINKSGYNPDFTMISMSQYAALLQAMGSLQEKFVVNNARFYSSLANAQADLDNLAFNQCVIIADVTATDPIPEIYFKNSESQLELLAGIGEYTFQAGTTTTQTLAPGSDATVSVSFVASGKTITMNFTFGIPKGDTGATGNGIASVAKVGTVGLVDTYRITFTDGSHFDFDLTNGTLAGKIVSNESFVYDSGSSYTLSEQLARFIYGLIEADKNKLKQIVAYQPNNGGPGDSYNIVWRYANSLYGGGAGNFYFLNDNNGSLLTIDGHLESYKFSIFYEDNEITVAGIGYFELSSSDTSGYLDDDQAEEARKTICFIKRGNEIFHFSQEYEGTKYFHTIPLMRVTGYKQGSIEINGLDSNSPTWEYASEDYDMDSAPTQNSTNLVTSGGVHSAIATASAALDSKISKNAEDIAAMTEALIKKDLYETQEATFQGMTAVPAGALVKAYLGGFKGNSAVVNQLVDISQFFTASSTPVAGVYRNRDITAQTYTFNGTSTEAVVNSGIVPNTYPQLIKGHTYLWITTLIGGSVNISGRTTTSINGGYVICPRAIISSGINTGVTSVGQSYAAVFTQSGTPDSIAIAYGFDANVVFNNAVFQFMLIDLTIAPLTSAEMASVSTAKAALKPKGMDVDSYIPYNTGTLTDSKPTKLISHGFNAYNEVLRTGYYDGTTGVYISSSVVTCNEDPIEVQPSTTYYFYCGTKPSMTRRILFFKKDGTFISSTTIAANTTFTTPANCELFCFNLGTDYGTTYQNDICINLSSSMNGQYKPYVPPIEYDLTMPALKSAGSVQDDAYGGNKGTDKVTKLTYNSAISPIAIQGAGTANERVLLYFNGVPLQITPSSSVKYDMTTNRYVADKADNVYGHTTDKIISLTRVAGAGGTYLVAFQIYDSALIGKTTSEIETALQGLVINVGVLPSEPFSDPISYPEIFDAYAGGSLEVVGDGCDATTKVYFYVEA